MGGGKSSAERTPWRPGHSFPVRAECLGTLHGHDDTVYSVAFAPNDVVVTGSSDKTAKLWNAATQECLATLSGHDDCVVGVAVAADGRIVTCSSDGTVKIWRGDTNECVATLDTGCGLNCVAIVVP